MIAMIMFPRYLMNSGQGMLGAAPMMTLTSASGDQAGRGSRGGDPAKSLYFHSLSPAWRSVTPTMVLRCLHSARCHPQLSTLSLNYDQDELNLSRR